MDQFAETGAELAQISSVGLATRCRQVGRVALLSNPRSAARHSLSGAEAPNVTRHLRVRGEIFQSARRVAEGREVIHLQHLRSRCCRHVVGEPVLNRSWRYLNQQ